MFHLSASNLTQDIIQFNVIFSLLGQERHAPAQVSPSCTHTFPSLYRKTFTMLELDLLTEKSVQASRGILTREQILESRSGFGLVACDPALPWNIFRIRNSCDHHQLVVLPKRSLSSFLAEMPSSLPLSSLMLPGTHNSVAFYGWPVSQCQAPGTDLSTQFLSGIRVLDIRLSIINGTLISYHGIYPQNLPFLDILRAVHTFLTSSEGKNEALVMSIKQEDRASLLFSQLVHNTVYNGPGGRDMWFLENRVPTLGEVRGKVVLVSRFGGNGQGWEGGLEGLGIHPTTWPDSRPEGFEWWLKGTKVKTHDWYTIPSFLDIPEKAMRSSRLLLQPSAPALFPVLSITYLSAASFPLALPKVVACGFGWPSWGLGVEGVNSRVGKWILKLLSRSNATDTKKPPSITDVETRRHGYSDFGGLAGSQVDQPKLRGWCLMDYFQQPVDVGLVALLVECNYRGRKSGEEGWP